MWALCTICKCSAECACNELYSSVGIWRENHIRLLLVHDAQAARQWEDVIPVACQVKDPHVDGQ